MESSDTYEKDGTIWTKTVGTIIKNGGPRRICQPDGEHAGWYYISNFEPKEVDQIPIGTKVSFDCGHPGDRRGVAINVVELKNV